MKITVSGYASPLHTDDYNHILSQRRIASFLNLLRAWKGGALHEALSNGHLRIVRKLSLEEMQTRAHEMLEAHGM